MSPVRILVAEDERHIREGLVDLLVAEGYLVEAAADGEAALQRLTDSCFDLVLLDIMMPRRSGFDVCREIRRRNLPLAVIMLTAKGEEVDKVVGLELGADDYITKPFRVRELMSRLRSILRRAGGQDSAEQLHLGNISINVKQARASKDGEEIPLTALEYRLLLTLAAHSGQVLSRAQLLEGIWDAAGEFVNDNTLSVYIKRLREKLGDDPQNPRLIQTVRGLGYRAGE